MIPEAAVNFGPRFSPDAVGGGAPTPEAREQLLKGKIAVVTGSSRGIGAEIASALGEAGADVIGNHRDPTKEKRQNRTADRVRAFGSSFESVLADISEEEGRQALLEGAIGDPQNPRGIDYLILNAAGGLETDKGKEYARQINVDSQLALIDLFLPYMNPGGKIIYITSVWAHRYKDPTIKQLPAYDPVAETKHEAEMLMRGRTPEFQQRDIKLGVVVGHVITGTSAHTMFSRMIPEKLAEIEQLAEGGKFPSAADMGRAVRDLIESDAESGHTLYIGGTNTERIDQIPVKMDRQSVSEQLLPMYGDHRMYIDEIELNEDRTSAQGSYTVRSHDTDGHFGGEYADIQIWPGHLQLETIAQFLGGTYALAQGGEGLGVFSGIRGPVKFEEMVFTGNKVDVHVQITETSGNTLVGNGQIRIGEDVIMTANGLEATLIPSIGLARRVVRAQQRRREQQMEAMRQQDNPQENVDNTDQNS